MRTNRTPCSESVRRAPSGSNRGSLTPLLSRSPEHFGPLPLLNGEAGALARRHPESLADERPVDAEPSALDQVELPPARPEEPVQRVEARGRELSLDPRDRWLGYPDPPGELALTQSRLTSCLTNQDPGLHLPTMIAYTLSA